MCGISINEYAAMFKTELIIIEFFWLSLSVIIEVGISVNTIIKCFKLL